MVEKKEAKRTSTSERVVKKTLPKPKPVKKAAKKEYTIVLIKPNVLIVSLGGINRRVARPKGRDLKVGDKIKI